VCYRSQAWLPTVHEVLQADWHEVWHSPQPPIHESALQGCAAQCFDVLFHPYRLLALLYPHFTTNYPPSVKGTIFSAPGAGLWAL